MVVSLHVGMTQKPFKVLLYTQKDKDNCGSCLTGGSTKFTVCISTWCVCMAETRPCVCCSVYNNEKKIMLAYVRHQPLFHSSGFFRCNNTKLIIHMTKFSTVVVTKDTNKCETDFKGNGGMDGSRM